MPASHEPHNVYGLAQVVVFSWRTCPFCVNAKKLLTEMGADFKAVELDQSTSEGKAIRAELGQVCFRHTTSLLVSGVDGLQKL